MQQTALGPRFPRLFSSLAVGNIVLKNRILSSGHDTVMAKDGAITEQLVAYHRARAGGGVGLIVTQVVGVHETARYTSHVLMGTDDSCIAGFRRLADAVHEFGTPLFAQLFHPGREIMESQDGSAPVALAPSAVPNERFRVMPRAMSVDLVEEVIDGYAQAATRLREATLDGVEVVASHGYLPAQFLNERVNHRRDAYGGTPENRLRFLSEVLGRVRSAVGQEFVVGLRISADEKSAGGLTKEEAAWACERLALDPGLDYISVCAGSSATLAGSDHIAPPMSAPAAYTAELARLVKAAVKVPVFVAGRINQPQEAESVLTSGAADACAMTRALICDPALPEKASGGRADEIRACIGCNQACIGHFHAGYPISCIQRPETGRELVYGVTVAAKHRRRVIVVGGGPAGLKAATVAAQRGHDVTLYEAGKRLGGQVLLAEQLPGRAEFGGAATNLIAEAERAGVAFTLNTAVDRELVMSLRPEVLVIATGARPRRPLLDLADGMPVYLAWDIIQGEVPPRGKVVVVDWRSDWIGLGVAQLLARLGRPVTMAVTGYQAGEALQQYVRDSMLVAAYKAKVEMLPLVRPYGADENTVYLQHVLTGEPVLVDGVSSLVLAHGHEPVNDLIDTIAGYPGEVHAIGDCLSPRTVEEAVLEGLKVGTML